MRPPVRLIAPRLTVMLPPAAEVPVILLLPAVMFNPLKVCTLASPAAPASESVPPDMYNVDEPSMILAVGALAAAKSSASVPPPTLVAPVLLLVPLTVRVPLPPLVRLPAPALLPAYLLSWAAFT